MNNVGRWIINTATGEWAFTDSFVGEEIERVTSELMEKGTTMAKKDMPMKKMPPKPMPMKPMHPEMHEEMHGKTKTGKK